MTSNEIVGVVLGWLVTTGIPLVTMYNTNKAKIKDQEHRMTVVEMKLQHAEDKMTHNATRLDGHDEQNRIMFQLVEKVGTLTDTVNELKRDIKELNERGK
ncbi:hypothetical protein NHG28_06590 [Aerococcaceae bacterium NML201209]|nr:hypothetical protein [Aerococcaceae bacterium NML201209]MCW6666941.1 hypothetical protein [Aerococcaceae bacterium NML190938]